MSEANRPNDTTKKLTIKTISICQVCGDGATINNYGVLSCFSCRTFFRRNAFIKKDPPICRFNSECEINLLTRKICTACRLTKCLAVGMSPDLIRREDLAVNKRKLSTSISEEAIVTITPQSVEDPNRSDISNSDQLLISNIVYAFDTFNPVAEIRHTIALLNISASNFQYDVSQSLGIMSIFYNSLQSFICSIPDFKVLTPTEQCSLFQRNMPGLLCLGGMYLMRESGIFDKPENEMILLPLYGPDIMKQAKRICQQLHDDLVLLKLTLVALAFSSNCHMLHNRANIDKDSLLLGTFRLLGSQNVYVELIWKYLIHTYNHQLAVQKFSTLIRQLLDTLNFSIYLHENNPIHQAFIDNIIEQMEKSSIATENAIVPLWGKKL